MRNGFVAVNRFHRAGFYVRQPGGSAALQRRVGRTDIVARHDQVRTRRRLRRVLAARRRFGLHRTDSQHAPAARHDRPPLLGPDLLIAQLAIRRSICILTTTEESRVKAIESRVGTEAKKKKEKLTYLFRRRRNGKKRTKQSQCYLGSRVGGHPHVGYGDTAAGNDRFRGRRVTR